MQTVSMIIQVQNPLFSQVRRGVSNFNRSLSKLKIISFQTQADRASASASTKFNRESIADLVKLLYKRDQSDPPHPDIYPGVPATPWMDLKAALEEMSPWQITLLKRLCYEAGMEYLPWDSFYERWREYHGSNDWAGLLDPLDENLREEIVGYVDLIQNAYRCFHFDQGTGPKFSGSESPFWPYRPTKSLYVTTSVGLPKWMDDVAPNLSRLTQRTSYFGYVAICDDFRELHRMGRKDIIIVLRGTATFLEWVENIRFNLVPLDPIPSEEDWKDEQPKVARGFLSLYKTAGAHVPSLSESVVAEVRRLMKWHKDKTLSITVIGHSLGAALALLVADDLSTCALDTPVSVFTFGGPRVGNQGFWNRLCTKNVKVLRIVNSPDVVTKVPGILFSEYLDNYMPWSHGGTELNVHSKNSPFLKYSKNSPLLKWKADKASSHDLEAYAHLVDGFLDSNCPFGSITKMLENLEYRIITIENHYYIKVKVRGSVGSGYILHSCVNSLSYNG